MYDESYDLDELLEALNCIGSEHYNYADWTTVGMALKEAGADVSDFIRWSNNDPDPKRRASDAKIAAKWNSFEGSGITAKTIFKWARDAGWGASPVKYTDRALSWDDEILAPVKVNTSGEIPVTEPQNWNQFDQVRRYINALFKADDYIAFNTSLIYDSEKGKYKPADSGVYTKTAGELLADLDRYETSGDLTNVLGSLNRDGGAYIRFNPMDGKGVGNKNVTEYRYALIESDSMPIEKQRFMMEELKLPIRIMVHSGGKSVHAIVKIDAKNKYEYRERVDYLHEVCNEAGLETDEACKNESRLSRLPGVYRAGRKQFIIEGDSGLPTWQEWYEYQESLKDKLPPLVNLEDLWNDPPPLKPVLINGILRRGHKMIISGPSKAGKSFLLLELAVAIAEGHAWLGHKCKKGKVLYVNMEIDGASFANRFINIYNELGMDVDANRENIDIWNMRGNSMPLSKLIDPLLRRAKTSQYAAIILDPLYKIMEGDENSNSDVGRMTTDFDRIAQGTGASLIYVHHFAKGFAGERSAIDRGSGAGTFARDPDAIVTLSPLEQKEEEEERFGSAWRVEYTVRDFPDPGNTNVFFQYPLHRIDNDSKLSTRAIVTKNTNVSKSGRNFLNQLRKAAEQCDMVEGGYKATALAKKFSEMFEEITPGALKMRMDNVGIEHKSLGTGDANIYFIPLD